MCWQLVKIIVNLTKCSHPGPSVRKPSICASHQGLLIENKVEVSVYIVLRFFTAADGLWSVNLVNSNQ